jgi:hypothetical protein
MSEYKRLGFVSTYASQATSLAGHVYTQARTFVPGLAEPYVQQLEDTAITYGLPYVTVAQDTAEKVLGSVDAQVGPELMVWLCLHTAQPRSGLAIDKCTASLEPALLRLHAGRPDARGGQQRPELWP